MRMKLAKRDGFTLVELLVVIGIIGILITVLMMSFSGSTESARAAKCLSNMKNLATAATSYAMANEAYPRAGSTEYMYIETADGSSHRAIYRENKGWISWYSKGKYPAASHVSNTAVGMGSENLDEYTFAITNGALWKYVSENMSVYVCPTHTVKSNGVRWSYLMNAYFGWASSENYVYQQYDGDVNFGSINADRVLLFAEVPFQGAGSWFPAGSSGGSTDDDAILQYDGCDKAPTVRGRGRRNGNEHIGCNHKSGRHWYAHVAFADGHVEKLQASVTAGTPIDGSELVRLTTWLCTGKDVSFDGKHYQEMGN